MPAPNPSVALANALADEFVRLGLEHVCLAPGSRSAALAMAFEAREELTVHVGIDERSVGFFALGIARATGRPVAVLSTSGTAGVNFHPAVVEADADCVPLVVLTADRPPELRGTGANQTIDQVKLYGDAVRLFIEVGVAHDHPGANAYWRSTTCRAWSAAAGHPGPPGPVHLNLAFREPLVPESDDGRAQTKPFEGDTSGRPDGSAWTQPVGMSLAPSVPELERLAGRLGEASRGIVVAGGGAKPGAPIADLAARLGWPLLAEPHSGARRGPTAIGSYHHLLGTDGFVESHRPDFILRVGRVALSRPLMALLSSDVPQVLLDAHGRWLDPGRAVAAVVAGDPAEICAQLEVTSGTEEEWLDVWQEADDRAQDAIDEVLDEHAGVTEPGVARGVAAAMPEGGLLVTASSMPIRDLDRCMRPRDDLEVISNRGVSGIDGFVSTALGTAVSTSAPTAALAGDLSLLHDGNGFLTLDESADCTFVVVNNDGGGIFHFLPQARFEPPFERLFGTPHGRDLERFAALHHLSYERIERPDDVVAALDASLDDGGIRIIEVRTRRGDNVQVYDDIASAVAATLP